MAEQRVRDAADSKDEPVIQHLYGIDIRTRWAVTGVAVRSEGPWDVELAEGDTVALAAAAAYVPPAHARSWAQHAALPDGSTYRRWTDLFEFLVSPDARHIQARTLTDGCREALLAYLLVDALALSMVQLGWEPLHATAVLTMHGVVGFIGESGEGKSTLGALFVAGGCPLVTDDMLVLRATRQGFLAEPGPPRIKLYRDIAARIFGSGRTGVPMNPATAKLIIPLADHDAVREAHPLAALYLIAEDRTGDAIARPSIRRLSPSTALPRILASTAPHYPSRPERIRNQFAFVTDLVRRVPIKTLSYPRDTERMSSLPDVVLADLAASAAGHPA
ncbi:MAG: hypothetical protein V7647_4182 [Acidobacteriota bacterium]|jgi:hypothetical protein